MAAHSAVDLLDDNPQDLQHDVTSLLLQIADNILNFPDNIKFRRLRLSNKNIADKLLNAAGAIECLFEMGFEEAEDSFVLPSSTSLGPLRHVRERLYERVAGQSQKTHKKAPIVAPPSSPSKVQMDFLNRVDKLARTVQIYEDPWLQRRARACVPRTELWLLAETRLRAQQQEKQLAVESQGLPDLMLQELLYWFKFKFFSWVDKPACEVCTNPTDFIGMSQDPEHTAVAPTTELFACESGHITPFHRFSDPGTLLETRRGRCGEWANCFTLICRALGMDARIVYDETDHVWTEVWSMTQSRWLHCDPCEALLDAPLTYEVGWGKKLTYVMAYSRDDIQDVTWRYTQQPMNIMLGRRNLCEESKLVDVILHVRSRLQAPVSPARLKFLQQRMLREQLSMLVVPGQPRKVISESETQGRQSGSVEWRKRRGEIGMLHPGWVWRPSEQEVLAGKMQVKFSAAQNLYQHGPQTVRGWATGICSAENIGRKEERDWNMSYLARVESNCEPGWVEWKFEMPSGVQVKQVDLELSSEVFGSGCITWTLSSDKKSFTLPTGLKQFSSAAVHGSSWMTLRADLRGGDGSVAWQHTQLARQKLSDPSFPISVTLIISSDQ